VANHLVDLLQLRDRIKVAASDESELEDLLEEAEQLWEERTFRLWIHEVDRVDVVRNASEVARFCFLPLWPVESVTSVEQRTSWSGATWELLDPADYAVPPDSGHVNAILRIGGSYWREFVRVTYTGGYLAKPLASEAQTPASVRRAIITQVAFSRARTSGEKLDSKSKGFRGGSTQYLGADVHPQFEQLAKRLRRIA